MEIKNYGISKRNLLVTIVAATIFVSLAMAGNVYAIINGVPDGDGHPYVGLVVVGNETEGVFTPYGRCTCTLISPTVALTAAHCTDGANAAWVWFDSNVEGNPDYPFGGPSAYPGTPYTYDGYYDNPTKGIGKFIFGDVGVIVFDEPITMDTFGALPDADYTDTLPMRQLVEYVGYGSQDRVLIDQGPPKWIGPKIRNIATGEIVTSNFAWSNQFLRISANPAQGKGGTCYGDSGGPVFIEGTNIVIAVTSFGTNEPCAGLGYYTRVDLQAVQEWILAH